MLIAKYRKEGHPCQWWLSDFTMDQVEGRLANLETRLNLFLEAVKHVTEPGPSDPPKRSVVSSDGWAMIHSRRLSDLEVIEEKYLMLKKMANERRELDEEDRIL